MATFDRILAEPLRFVHAALLDPADEHAPDSPRQRIRRRVVCGATLAVGCVLLWISLALKPGDPWFYVTTLALAAVWIGGARASGPIPLGRARRFSGQGSSYAIVQSLILGGGLLVLFLGGALVVSQIPVLRGPVDALLDHARFGALWLVALITAINGLSEEYFFRGALFQAFPPKARVWASTLIYAVFTAFAGVPLLVLAGVMLGFVVALQRRATGGFLGPTITHLTWSLGMLFCLPLALRWGDQLFGR